MERVLKYIVIVVLTSVVVTLITALVLVWTMPALPPSPSNDHICLPDEHHILGCGSTTDVMRSYLQRAIEKEYNTIKTEDELQQQKFLDENRVRLMSIYDTYFWEMKPAAKVTGKKQPKPRLSDKGVDMTPIRDWWHGRELYDTNGFLRYGIRYRNGRLVVPVSGTYFLYSFVDLYETCDPSTGNPNVNDSHNPIKHGIYKFNILEEEDIEIVSNTQPHTVSSNRYFNSYSSYLSTLAELRAGDEVSVKVSNITYLKYPRGNFFGLNFI